MPPETATPTTPAAPAESTAQKDLDQIRSIVDSLAGPVETFATLIPVAGADIKLAVACLKGAVDAADTDVDQGASTGATILAALKGALAGL